MVIFIPPTYNINAYTVCIGSYRFSSTIGTNIVPFTLEQNNFMTKHILQFPNFAHVTIEVMHFSLMIPFSTYTTFWVTRRLSRSLVWNFTPLTIQTMYSFTCSLEPFANDHNCLVAFDNSLIFNLFIYNYIQQMILISNK